MCGILVLAVMLSISITSYASEPTMDYTSSSEQEQIMPRADWSNTVFLSSQSANTYEFFRSTATFFQDRYTITFTSTEGPTSVRVYIYEEYSDGKYDKLVEKTLHLNESVTINTATNNTVFATAMWVEGDSGYVTFHITAFT